MKTAEEISSEIARTVIADPDSGVTFTGIKGSLRGYIDAVSLKIRDMWYDITQAKRDSLIDTCSGIKLDQYIAQRSDLTRLPASNAGVLILISGAEGTVVPVGTILTNPTTKVSYTTQQTVTVGSKNHQFVFNGNINIKTSSIGDVTWAICNVPGIIGRSSANSITSTSINGISVINPSPAQGGSDLEDDEQFRQRFKDYIKVLNKGTKAYYQAAARAANSLILRTNVEKDYSYPDSVKLTIVTKSGIPLPDLDLQVVSSQIQEVNRSYETVSSLNIAFVYLFVQFQVSLVNFNGDTIDGDQHFISTADALAKYLNWQSWEWGAPVSTDDLFVVCQGVAQTAEIPLGSFKINGSNNVNIPIISLPYFMGLRIIDITNPNAVIVRENTNIVQNFTNVTLESEQF